MAHHAYFVAGDIEEGIQNALTFVDERLDIETVANPDVITLRYGLMSVEHARALRAHAELAPVGKEKVIIISASRFFHESQNALLKLFEEPPAHTTLILVLPAEGLLLSTLRSRLIELPEVGEKKSRKHGSPGITVGSSRVGVAGAAHTFLTASKTEREKIITKLLDRTRSDNDDEKQSARLDAIRLVEGLTQIAHDEWLSTKTPTSQKSAQLFLDDLTVFLPILHERSAPLKLIFEHILLTTPQLSVAK